jgi:O-methyltransferase
MVRSSPAFLRQYPDMQGLLYDLPEVIATVPTGEFAGCEGRIRLESGNFFESVPEKCDAYILKHIIHNWSDDNCGKILALLREQLPANGRVLICEMIIQSDHVSTPAKMLDIEMLVMTPGGRERSPEEFQDLLALAGLRLSRVVQTASPLCVLEALAN